MSLTLRTPVAYLYPEGVRPGFGKRITYSTLKKHFSRERLLELANEFLEADKRFPSDITFINLVKRLMAGFEVTIAATPDLKPLPKDVSRLIFIQRKPKPVKKGRKMSGRRRA